MTTADLDNLARLEAELDAERDEARIVASKPLNPKPEKKPRGRKKPT